MGCVLIAAGVVIADLVSLGVTSDICDVVENSDPTGVCDWPIARRAR
jgi:hypothetical protein